LRRQRRRGPRRAGRRGTGARGGPRARDGTRPTWLAERAAVSWARRGTIGTQQPTTRRPTYACRSGTSRRRTTRPLPSRTWINSQACTVPARL